MNFIKKRTKYLIIILLLSVITTRAYAETLNFTGLGKINTDVLDNQNNLGNDLVLTAIPLDFYKSYETLTISWQPTGETCNLYYSESPGGRNLSNYSNLNVSGTGSINKTPSQLGLGVGSYYCVVANSSKDIVSAEFRLIIESERGVQMVQPVGAITDPVPTFNWQPNTGVPYYHIVVSDNPFVIEEDAQGNLQVTGAQAIWQAITPNTSIEYGAPDPSGYSKLSPPPIVSGIQYNWIVVNNYGNAIAYSSDVVTQPQEFTFETDTPMDPPTLISPANTEINDTTFINGDENITFEWSEVENAMVYEIFLSEIRMEDGSEVKYTVFNKTTTNTFIDFSARNVLVNANYTWKIIATNDDDNSAVSEVFEFSYRIVDGTLNIFVRNNDNVTLSYATVEIDPIDGTSEEAPLLLGSNGQITKTLPVGSYVLTADKEGYETLKDTVDVVQNTTKRVDLYLDSSPASIYGNVVDGKGVFVSNAKVKAVNEDGEERTATANAGSYSLYVTPGYWTISASKEGYTAGNPLGKNITGGANLQLDNLKLVKNEKDLTGAVINTSGAPLKSVDVTAKSGNVSIQKITNASGNFTFKGISFGTWTIHTEKSGYTSPPDPVMEISSSSSDLITLNDIVLTPRANIVSGNANNSSVGLEDVTITATPPSGSPVQTTTDSYGNYSINLPSGDYNLTASLSNYTSQNSHVLNLSVGETLDGFDFMLTPNESFIEGKISDGNTGLKNVTVSNGADEVITNDLGRYSLSVSPGTYEVNASKTGYSSGETKTVSVGAGQTVDNINFSMAPNASVVSGKVQYAGTNVVNAAIKGYKRLDSGNKVSISEDKSDANGGFELNLLPGNYTIWADKSNFICQDSLTLNVLAGQNYQNKNISLIENIATITGVAKSENDVNLRAVSITITDQSDPTNIYSTVTNASGQLNINVTPGHAYEIMAQKSGSGTATVMTDELMPGSDNNYTLVLENLTSRIVGKIFDQNSKNIKEAKISIYNDENSYSTTSDINGKYSIDLDYGDYIMEIEKLGYESADSTIAVLPNQQDTVNFIIKENFSGLTGKIVDNNNTEIENVTVTANRNLGGGSTNKTDSEGNFRITGLLPGNYTIITEKDGYEKFELTEVSIPFGATITKDIKMVANGGILNVSVFSDGTALEDVTVNVEDQASGRNFTGVTNNLGETVILGLVVDNYYKISASKRNYFAETKIINFESNYEKSIEFDMIASDASLSGKVITSENGNIIGLKDAEITLMSPAGFTGSGRSGADGSFRIDGLVQENSYGISVVKSGYKDVEIDSVYLDAKDKTIDDLMLLSNNQVVSGKIVDQSGNSLSDILVIINSNIARGQSRTESDGSFKISNLAPYTSYELSTKSNQQGWEDIKNSVYIEENDLNVGTLTIQINDGKITGLITEFGTSKPVVGAAITAENITTGKSWSTSSGVSGEYNFNYLTAGTYSLTINKNSYKTDNITFELNERETETRDIELEYAAPVSVTGVLNDSNNNRIANSNIYLVNDQQSITTKTNLNGEFSFTDTVITYTKTSISTKFDDKDYENDIQILDIADTDVNHDLVIGIHSSSVSGIVIDSETGVELENVEINLKGEEDTDYITKHDGKYEFQSLYGGNYSLSYSKPGYEKINTSLNLTDFQNLVENVELVPLENTLAGYVYTETDDIVALENVQIAIVEDNQIIGHDTTSNSGAFEFSNLVYGKEYKIVFEKTGFLADTSIVEFNQSTNEIVKTLDMVGNAIVGTVKYNSVFQANAKVFARNLNGYTLSAVCNDLGAFKLEGLSGYYNMWANSEDKSLVSLIKPVNISSDTSIFEVLELQVSGVVEGIVTYNNVGKAGVNIILENLNTGNVLRGTTNGYGEYAIKGLRRGAYLISAQLEGFNVNENSRTLDVKTGTQVNLEPFTLSFSKSSISGTVLDEKTNYGINEASIVLLKNGTAVDTAKSSTSGSYLFENVNDGDYTISATHSAYNNVGPKVVTLTNGITSPATIDFELEAKEFLVFGRVLNFDNSPIENSKIEVYNSDTTITTYSNESGEYAAITGRSGEFKMVVTKMNYKPEYADIVLSNSINNIQRDIYIKQNPASLEGEIFLILENADVDSVSLQKSEISLFSKNMTLKGKTILENESSYKIENIDPGTYKLFIESQFIEDSDTILFTKLIDNIHISIGQDTALAPLYFRYNPNQANISGQITILDSEEIHDLSFAKLYLLPTDNNSLIDSVITNQSGKYNINNIASGNYRLKVTAGYGDEVFSTVSDIIEPESGESFEFNYQFDYILSSITMFITENGSDPLADTRVKISSDGYSGTFMSDETGKVQTDSVFHTQTPITVDINKSPVGTVHYINPLPFDITLSNLADTAITMDMAIKFDNSQIKTFSVGEPVKVIFQVSPEFGHIQVFYDDEQGNSGSVWTSGSNEIPNGEVANIEGEFSTPTIFYVKVSKKDGIYYNNADNPFILEFSSEGVIAARYSALSPVTPRFAVNDCTMFELTIKDDAGNILNPELEERGDVEWSLSSNELGTLVPLEDQKTKIMFKASGTEQKGEIKALVNLDNVYMNITTSIEVKQMKLSKLNISGPEELSNRMSAFFNVSAISDSGLKMTMPIDWEPIDSVKGILVKEDGGLRYYPDSLFIGNIDIVVSATDRNNDTTITMTKNTSVYQEIIPGAGSSVITSGDECQLNLPANMLKGQGTAKIFLSKIEQIPAIKDKGIEDQLESKIYKINSDKSASAFNQMPGLSFQLETETGKIAFWNNNDLAWVIIGEEDLAKAMSQKNLTLGEIPDWHEYGVVAASQPLGMRDIRLAPNPFTPYDVVGNNTGLQIMFTLTSDKSRYVSVTAKVYNIKGQLVRTIADKQALLKGDFAGGETNTLYWDGFTDDQKMARNGRYLLHMIVQDASNKKEYLKPIVLIK